MLPVLYVWTGSQKLACEGNCGQLARITERYSLLMAIEGRAAVRMDGKEYALGRGSCLVLNPGVLWRAEPLRESAATVLLTEFDRIPLAGETGDGGCDLEPGLGEAAPKSYSRIEELALALYEGREADGAKAYANNVLFQEMVYLLLSEDAASGERQAVRAVERTIAMLRRSETLDFTLAGLSGEAGLSPRHYSRIFRELTGQSPIDYQMGQRMERAKELLAATDETIHSIAFRIGFRDPFHFSRSFKQHTGLSPRLYTKLGKESVRLVSLQFLGEMLALGIKPVGAPSQLLACRHYWPHVEGIQVVGANVVTPYLDKLSALKPDVIVTFNGHHANDYAQIAHTLDISWTMPFFERFRLIADKVGKAEAAERWLERYGQVTAKTQERLAPHLHAGETVSLLWMRGLPATFQAYFDVGVLYRDLGFRAPSATAAVRQQRDHPFKADIPLGQLEAYAGDHLFVVVSSDPDSVREYDRLTASPQWQELEAVRRGRVYRLTEDWLWEDPVTMMEQMAETAARITNG